MPLPRLGTALLAALLILGCGKAMQRRLPDGLTDNQRLDVELFELFVRFAQDSLDGTLLVDPRLPSAAHPTIGLESDGTRADPGVTTEARRAVVRRLGLAETTDPTVGGCRATSAMSRGAPDVGDCPLQNEVRIGLGPITTHAQPGQQPVGAGPYYARAGVMQAGPTGKVYIGWEMTFAQVDGAWRVVGHRETSRVE